MNRSKRGKSSAKSVPRVITGLLEEKQRTRLHPERVAKRNLDLVRDLPIDRCSDMVPSEEISMMFNMTESATGIDV